MMIFSLLVISLTQLLALSNAAPQLQDDMQLCPEGDGRVPDARWAEMFGILGIIGEEPDGISKYFFVINEYDGHFLVQQHGCYQQVEEASDLTNQETSCVDMTAYPVLGGPNTDIEEFKRFARRMQAESNRANETISLTVPTVTGDRTFGVVVESEGTQSPPLQINNAYWECQVSQANADYSECLWRPRPEMRDWKIFPYTWTVGEVADMDMASSESEVELEIDAEDLEGVPIID